MANKPIVKNYSNEEITVIWKPEKCIHSGVCVSLLPDVYNPRERPWIKPENASGSELKQQIDQCPSGALSYRLKEKGAAANTDNGGEIQVSVVANGPLLVQGTVEVTLAGGKKQLRKRSTAFCRCGASSDKPFCDGSHRTISFSG